MDISRWGSMLECGSGYAAGRTRPVTRSHRHSVISGTYYSRSAVTASIVHCPRTYACTHIWTAAHSIIYTRNDTSANPIRRHKANISISTCSTNMSFFNTPSTQTGMQLNWTFSLKCSGILDSSRRRGD